MKKIISLLIAVICFTACPIEEEMYGFQLERKHLSDNIAYYVGVNENRETLYPDTVLPIEVNKIIHFGSKSNISYWETRDKNWKKIFKNSDSISVFIFNVDTLNKYSWEQIRENYNIIVRYDLSSTDLKYLNYRIYYPPNGLMQHMKMYPPYPGK